jgi:hypothetical protein
VKDPAICLGACIEQAAQHRDDGVQNRACSWGSFNTPPECTKVHRLVRYYSLRAYLPAPPKPRYRTPHAHPAFRLGDYDWKECAGTWWVLDLPKARLDISYLSSED